MSEYSKDKLYYLKLPKGFFDEYYVKILEGMPNGKDYLLMYMKLMCESISHSGYLRYSKDAPYTEEMIASVTGTNIDIVRSGLKALESLELIVPTTEGSLFIPNVQKMTSITTKGAETKAIQRTGGQTADICPPDIRVLDNRYLDNKKNDTEEKDGYGKEIASAEKNNDLTDDDLKEAAKTAKEIWGDSH